MVKVIAFQTVLPLLLESVQFELEPSVLRDPACPFPEEAPLHGIRLEINVDFHRYRLYVLLVPFPRHEQPSLLALITTNHCDVDGVMVIVADPVPMEQCTARCP